MAQLFPCPHCWLSNPQWENSPLGRLRDIDLRMQKKVPGRWIGHARGKQALPDLVRIAKI